MQSSRYRISRLIERGGTAEVYEASVVGERGFERKVALKKLREDFLSEEGLIDHFVDEARIAAQLHHANIINVFDFGMMDGVPFLVLELVDGLDLNRLAKRAGQIPPEIALAITLEVARGLAYAHKAKDTRGQPLRIVHRDVSPSNVLVSFGGDVKISDFGIALAVERLTKTRIGIAKGKLSFMSPEQMHGSAVDGRADIYALGCLLHWMVTEVSPLDDEEVRETVRRGGDCTLSSDLDTDLAAIITRATKTDPQRRHRSAEELAADVGSALMRRVIDRDARDLVAAFMERMEPQVEIASRPPIAEMMDVELVLADSMEPLRRFESVVQEGKTAFSDAQTREVTPLGQEKTQSITPPSTDKLLGTVLHGYRLIGLLGAGSVARVYRARHLVLDREYAVKVLFGRAADQERGRVRLHREAQALSKLQHPNIVSVIDFGVTPDGRSFLTMELLRGETLKALMKREGKVDPARAARIARQIASGLDAAHRAGVIHRDLKPANVMLVEEKGREVVKILDFGIARAQAEGTRITASDQLLGTPRYMAPEQIRGASRVGPSADLYALGTVLYAMLNGSPPFSGSTLEVVERQLTEKPKPLQTGTPLDELVLWLLAKNPEERPPSAERVVALLNEAGFRDEVTRTQLLPARSVAADGGRSLRVLVPAVVGLMIAVGSLAAALWWPRSESVRQPPRPAAPPAAAKEPVVVARPGVEPPPPPPPRPAPPPAVEESAPRRSKPPRPRREVSAKQIESEVREALHERGLTRRDLASSGATQALLQAFDAADDPEEMRRSADRLIAALDGFPIDDGLVKAKLDRIAKALGSADLERTALDRLENRYLDLRSSYRPGLSSSNLAALMIRLDELERELTRAAR